MDIEADQKHMGDDKVSIQESQPGTSVETTRRGLSPRHVRLMAIASGIGVGLFVVGYLLYGLGFIWPVSVNVAEMLSWLPIRGTIYELADRFVDPALGFAMGYTYFFATAMLVCTEYSAVATLAQYWTTDVNPAVWVAMCMAICYFLNMVAVRWFGETEFLMGSTKIMLLFGLILATFITMCGGNPNKDAYGFRNWANGDLAHPYYTDGSAGYFLSICVSIRYAVFTVGGPDVLSITAGEIRNPRSTLPRVAKMIAVRIITFYVLGVLAVGIICNSRNPRLLGAIESGSAGAAASPWVLGLIEVGVSGFLPDLINALILMSGLSCGNAYLYSASRALYSMAQNGKAPAVLARCTKSGVPWVAVTTVTAISLLTFLTASNAASEVFGWFLELTTVSIVVNNTCMAIVFIAWTRALKLQGIPRRGENTRTESWMDRFTLPAEARASNAHSGGDGDSEGIVFPYIARCATWTPYTCVAFGSTIAIFIGFDQFKPFSVRGFITCYFGLAWFVVMFVFWKVFKRTKFVHPRDLDILAGGLKQQMDDECRIWESDAAKEAEEVRMTEMNVMKRAWVKLWG